MVFRPFTDYLISFFTSIYLLSHYFNQRPFFLKRAAKVTTFFECANFFQKKVQFDISFIVRTFVK